MITLGALVPKPTDVTSWYRAGGPFGQIGRTHSRLAISFQLEWNWLTCSGLRGVFIQRPFTDDHRSAFEIMKDNGLKVWIDYDDLLFDVPTDNPTYFNYMNKRTEENVKFFLKHADFVTVSTEALKKYLLPLNKGIQVIPNALEERVLLKLRQDKPRLKRFAWRGSRTHHKDVFTYSPQIIEVANAEESKEWQWHFIGDNLWFLTDRMVHERTYVSKGFDVVDYHRHLTALQPTAVIVPLHDSPFNRSKSNIAWLEGSLANAICLAPDWEEWHRPGMMTYNSREQFRDGLRAIVRGEVDVDRYAKLSWEHVSDTLFLSKVNRQRMQIICELLECDEADLGAV